MNKICSVCGIEKDLSEFRFRADKNLHNTYCKDCERKKNKEYKLRNEDKIATYNATYMPSYHTQHFSMFRWKISRSKNAGH